MLLQKNSMSFLGNFVETQLSQKVAKGIILKFKFLLFQIILLRQHYYLNKTGNFP